MHHKHFMTFSLLWHMYSCPETYKLPNYLYGWFKVMVVKETRSEWPLFSQNCQPLYFLSSISSSFYSLTFCLPHLSAVLLPSVITNECDSRKENGAHQLAAPECRYDGWWKSSPLNLGLWPCCWWCYTYSALLQIKSQDSSTRRPRWIAWYQSWRFCNGPRTQQHSKFKRKVITWKALRTPVDMLLKIGFVSSSVYICYQQQCTLEIQCHICTLANWHFVCCRKCMQFRFFNHFKSGWF